MDGDLLGLARRALDDQDLARPDDVERIVPGPGLDQYISIAKPAQRSDLRDAGQLLLVQHGKRGVIPRCAHIRTSAAHFVPAIAAPMRIADGVDVGTYDSFFDTSASGSPAQVPRPPLVPTSAALRLAPLLLTSGSDPCRPGRRPGRA